MVTMARYEARSGSHYVKQMIDLSLLVFGSQGCLVLGRTHIQPSPNHCFMVMAYPA